MVRLTICVLVAACFSACGSSGGNGDGDGGVGDGGGGGGDAEIASWLGHLQFGTIDNESANAVIVDSKRNAYVIGATHGDLSTGGTATISSWFVTRLSASGSRLWTRQWHRGAALRGAVGKNDELYVVGEHGVARLDTSGEIVWDLHPQTDVKDIVIAPDGDLVLAGIRSGVDVGTAMVFPPIGPLQGAFDGHVLRLDAKTGIVKWYLEIGSDHRDFTASVAPGAAGEVYVAGTTQGQLPGGTHVGPAEAQNGFLMRVEANGTLGWTRQFGFPSGGRNIAKTVRRDAAGNLYVSGSSAGTLDGGSSGVGAFVARYDEAGNQTWVRYLVGAEPGELAIDPRGRVWTVGTLRGHGYAWVLDSAGNQVAQRFIDDAPSLGTGGDLYGRKGANALGLAFAGGEFVYVVGGNVGDLGGNLNASALQEAPQGEDAFVVKLDLDARFQGVSLAPTPPRLALTSGASGSVSVSPVDARGAAVAGPVVWTASQPAIASVDGSGRVQAVADGHAYLTPSLGRFSAEPARVKVGSAFGTVMFGTRHGDVPRALALAPSGELFVGGWSDDSFDGQTLGDAFLARLDAQGERAWLTQFGGGEGDTLAELVSDAAGNTYGLAVISAAPVPDAKKTGWVVISFDTTGNERWRYAALEQPVLTALTVDTAGNVYVAGSVANLTYNRESTMLIKLDSMGNQLWTYTTNPATWGRSLSPNGIALDSGGNLIVSTGEVVFKLDPTGTNVIWSAFVGGGGMALDPSGDIFLARWSPAGTFDDLSGPYRIATGSIARLGTDGVVKWTHFIGSEKGFTNVQGGVFALALDSAGNIYGAGSIDGTQSLDGTLAGGRDALVVKLAPNGTPVWTRQLGTAENDYATALAVRPSGALVVVGYTFGNLGGSSLRGRIARSNCDVFVAEFNPDGSRR